MALIDKASLLMVPSTYEAGKLYNVLPSGNRAPDSTDQNSGYDQTRADFDFDRGSNAAATRIDSNGVLQKYRENLLLQSNNFSDSDWTKTNVSVTSNYIANPVDGSVNAPNITIDQTAGSYEKTMTQRNLNFVSGNVYCVSVWMKAGSVSSDTLRILAYDGGQVHSSSYIYLDDIENTPCKYEAGDNGWNRFYFYFKASNTAAGYIYIFNYAYGQVTNAGTNLYLYGAQWELGTYPTDYLESTSVTGKAGVLVDLPRINYDANGENGALLLEPSRQQLIQYSEWFDNSYWAREGTGGGNAPIVTQNHAISPEGFKNASRVQFDTNGSTSTHRSGLVRDFAFTTGDKYAISCYVKSASGSDEIFTFRIAGAQVGGEKTATNEWQLFTETHTATATTTDNFGIQIRGNYSSQTSDILIYGMQLESGVTYASSYIPNHGESGGVTRAADDMPVLDINPLNVGTTASIYFEGTNYKVGAGNSRMWATFDNTLDNGERFLLFTGALTSSTFQINLQHKTGGVTKNIAISNLNRGEMFKCVAIFNGTALQLYVNGSLVGSETITAKDNFYYLDMTNVQGDLGLATKQFIVFDSALTQSEAEALTTL